MKKRHIIFLTVMMLLFTVGQSVQAQTRHYKYSYTIKSDGTTTTDANYGNAKEYSITYSQNGFFFSRPDGSPLSRAFIFDWVAAGCKFLYTSNNICVYETTGTYNELKGVYKKYNANVYTNTYLEYIGSSSGNLVYKVFVSSDEKTMVIVDSSTAAVYTQIANRTIPGHVSMSNAPEVKGSESGYGSNSGYNNGSYNNGSAGSTGGTLVGSYQAFGLLEGNSGTITKSNYFNVYKDAKGYYVISNGTMNRFHSNTNSTYLGYNVSQYNYWFYDSYTRTFWYLRL